MKLVSNSLDEFLVESTNFERGRDPKAAMGIGIINKIDSYTLQNLEILGVEGLDDFEDDEREFLKQAESFLKYKITYGKFFDWKEEEEMKNYVSRYARGRYVYNAYPDADGIQVVFSKIELPNAEEIEV